MNPTPSTQPQCTPQDRGGSPPATVLVIATANDHKVAEIASRLAALAGDSVLVRGAGHLPPGPAPEETGSTFLENARIKARATLSRAMLLPEEARPDWVVADDSGLEVDALGGAPGVLSARFAGPGSTDIENNLKLLHALASVPAASRGASFVCVLAALPLRAGVAPAEIHAEGRTRGSILQSPRGAGGFGYDPLFLVPELGKTYAELSAAEKNEASHRGKALLALWRELAHAEAPGAGGLT